MTQLPMNLFHWWLIIFNKMSSIRSTLFLFIFICFYSLISKGQNSESPVVCSGKIDRLVSFPSKFISNRNIDIWLPKNYSPQQKYAVLYMHDGQMLFDANKTWNKQEWGVDETLTKLFENKDIKNCIVVGIWNTQNRHAEYFPEKPFNSLSKAFKDSLLNKALRYGNQKLFSIKVCSDNYLKFIVTELKPYIDKNYSVKKDLNNTFIAGSSMGGLISMYALCEYPTVFGGAICMSTHWPGIHHTKNNPIPIAFANYINKNMAKLNTQKLYFDYGTKTLDQLYEPFHKMIDKIVQDKKYKYYITKKFEGHDHSENSWRMRLEIPFKFLLKK